MRSDGPEHKKLVATRHTRCPEYDHAALVRFPAVVYLWGNGIRECSVRRAWAQTAYHFLNLELDILQAPFKVRYLDGHYAIVRGDLDHPGLGHRRREVDDEHSGCVLEESVRRATMSYGSGCYPSSLRCHVGSKEPLARCTCGWLDQDGRRGWPQGRVLITCSCRWLPKHYPERESSASGLPVRFSWPALQPLTEVRTRSRADSGHTPRLRPHYAGSSTATSPEHAAESSECCPHPEE